MKDSYKIQVKRRIPWLITLYVSALAFVGITFFYQTDSPLRSFVRGTQIGLSSILQGAVLSSLLTYRKALKDEGKLQALKISEG